MTTLNSRQIITGHNETTSVTIATHKKTNVSLLVRCPDFRGLNVCTLIQMGPWTSVLIIKVSTFQGAQFDVVSLLHSSIYTL